MASNIAKWRGHQPRARIESGTNYDRIVKRTGFDPLHGQFDSVIHSTRKAELHEGLADRYARELAELPIGPSKYANQLSRMVRRHEALALQFRKLLLDQNAELLPYGERRADRDGASAQAAVQMTFVGWSDEA